MQQAQAWSDAQLKPGEPVQVLTTWAFGADQAWLAGYSFVGLDRAGLVIVKHSDGPFEGVEVRYPADRVRRS